MCDAYLYLCVQGTHLLKIRRKTTGGVALVKRLSAMTSFFSLPPSNVRTESCRALLYPYLGAGKRAMG